MNDEFQEAEDSFESEKFWDPPGIRLSEIERWPHDEKLWKILPSRDDPYDPRWLSEPEVSALEETLEDGFGKIFGSQKEGGSLPTGVNSGLLGHQNYWAPEDYGSKPDESSDIADRQRWIDQCLVSEAALLNQLPMVFSTSRLRIFFRCQFERFSRHSQSIPHRLYEKPWYEVHVCPSSDNLRQMAA